MQQWWWAFAPILAAVLGYVARRWIERRRRAEGLKRKLQALALYQGMSKQGVTFDDLARIERRAGD